MMRSGREDLKAAGGGGGGVNHVGVGRYVVPASFSLTEKKVRRERVRRTLIVVVDLDGKHVFSVTE